MTAPRGILRTVPARSAAPSHAVSYDVDVEIDAARALADLLRARETILDAVPVVTATRESLLRLPLDHRSGFLLTRVDGVSKVRAIIAISAMDQDEVHTIIEELVTLGAIAFLEDDEEPTLRIPSTPPSRRP